MIEFHRASFGMEMNGKGMSHLVGGVRVQTINLGDWKTVKEVARVNAEQRRFFAAKLGEVSVEEYSKYNIILQYPDLPLVDITGQGGKRSQMNLLPPEVCEILPNQPLFGELMKDHTANMITVACKPPNVNGEAVVNQGLTHLGFRPPELPCLQDAHWL
ncbi:hypothetical protein SCLCIDRAFT_1174963 [Scleroderma citrinum Foug A]|uniref:PAZ domain-containing protein n=1 Tax=Scleroderma citrinum Foug A TaxID=1036808 RepID=A0A0C3E486_9AGAM|nr:hypothetical protein SCLCIDRAFT_1174963 [Scleroderma citrinum Foug A]